MYRQRHLRLREFNFLHNTTALANNGGKIVCTKDSARGFALLLLLPDRQYRCQLVNIMAQTAE